MADTPYPKRPPYFACRFVRLLTKRTVANDLSPQAFTLLTVIVMTEDARGYADPVTFTNHQLMPLVGAGSEDTLNRVRQKVVDTGWLYYVAGAKGRPGRYFVTIPARYRSTDDGPTDEGPSDEAREEEYPRTGAGENGVEGGGYPRTGAGESRGNVRGEAEGMCGPLLPVPSPVPVAASKPDAAPPSTEQPDQKPTPGSPPPPKPRRKEPAEKKPRKVNPVFEAIIAATDANRAADGSNIGRVCAKLATYDPPFTPEEVADFAANWRRAFRWANRDEHPLLTINILGKHANDFRRWRRMNPPRAPATRTGPIEFDRLPPGG